MLLNSVHNNELQCQIHVSYTVHTYTAQQPKSTWECLYYNINS